MKVKIPQAVVEYLEEREIDPQEFTTNAVLAAILKEAQASQVKALPYHPEEDWDENKETPENTKQVLEEDEPELGNMHLIRPMFNGLTFVELSKDTNYNKVDNPMPCFVCSRLPKGQGKDMTKLKRGYFFTAKNDHSGRKLCAPLCPKHVGCDHRVAAEREEVEA